MRNRLRGDPSNSRVVQISSRISSRSSAVQVCRFLPFRILSERDVQESQHKVDDRSGNNCVERDKSHDGETQPMPFPDDHKVLAVQG